MTAFLNVLCPVDFSPPAVATDEQRAILDSVVDAAADTSDICRLLHGCLLVNADVRSLDDAADALPSW